MSTSPPETVIVVVDDDQALLDLLAGLLRGPDRVVDTVCGAEGVTPELLVLSQPRLVLINPRVGALAPEELGTALGQVRQATGARVVLMLAEEDREDGKALARALAADDAVPIPVLLRDPLARLVPEGGAPGPGGAAGGRLGLGALSAEAILSLDLVGPEPPRPPLPSSPSQQVRASLAAQALARLIDEELAKAGPPRKEQRFVVPLDTVGEHNLFEEGDVVRGVFVATVAPPPVGARVRVDVSFPWGARWELEGQVAWLRPAYFGRRGRGGMGVALEVADALAEAAARFVRLRAPLRAPELAGRG